MSNEIAQILLNAKAVMVNSKQPFKFASGILSPIYCDNRVLLSHVEDRKQVVQALREHCQKLGAQQIAGVATAGISWGAWVAESLSLPFLFVRSEAKAHGAGKQIEGQGTPALKTVVIEDLISTGGSSLAAASALQKEKYAVVGVVAIFTYQFVSAQKRFDEKNIPLLTATSLEELLNQGTQQGYFSPEDAQSVLAWRDQQP